MNRVGHVAICMTHNYLSCVASYITRGYSTSIYETNQQCKPHNLYMIRFLISHYYNKLKLANTIQCKKAKHNPTLSQYMKCEREMKIGYLPKVHTNIFNANAHPQRN